MNIIKKFLCTLLLSLFFVLVQAQSEKVSIKFAPLALADEVSMPTIQGGIDVKLSNRISWYNEIGIKYRKCINELSDTPFVESRGYKLKTEIRYHLTGLTTGKFKEPVPGFYLGGNAYFINDYHNTKVGYFAAKDSSTTKLDAFGVHKKVFGMNLLVGYQHSIYKNFLIDFYAGLGVRMRMVSTVNKEFNKDIDSLYQPVDFGVLSIRDYVDAAGGNSFVPSITGGFRLCYKF